MSCWMSFAVTTRCTPAIACAALTSMRRILPCDSVLRKILPYSMPGSLRLWTYSARPPTLSQDSRRSTERPICEVSAGLVERFMDGSAQVHADQLLLVGGGAVQVAFDLHLGRGGFAGLLEELVVQGLSGEQLFRGGETRRPVGRRAHHDARLLDQLPLEIKRHGHAERRPVVGRARGALQVRRRAAG